MLAYTMDKGELKEGEGQRGKEGEKKKKLAVL